MPRMDRFSLNCGEQGVISKGRFKAAHFCFADSKIWAQCISICETFCALTSSACSELSLRVFANAAAAFNDNVSSS